MQREEPGFARVDPLRGRVPGGLMEGNEDNQPRAFGEDPKRSTVYESGAAPQSPAPGLWTGPQPASDRSYYPLMSATDRPVRHSTTWPPASSSTLWSCPVLVDK